MSDTPLPVFDGHNDLLLRLWRAEPAAREAMWLNGDGGGLDYQTWTSEVSDIGDTMRATSACVRAQPRNSTPACT